MKNLVLLLTFVLPIHAGAENTEKQEAAPKQFEIIDGNAPITGAPGADSEAARAKWSKACSEWKNETRELNRKNEVLSLVCGSEDCAYQDNGSYVCSSTASYKLKIEGVKASSSPIAAVPAPAPVVAPMATTNFRTDLVPNAHLNSQVYTPSTQVTFEITPAPRHGFIWVPGYWSWHSQRNVWYPGRWQAEVGHWHRHHQWP